MGVAELPGGVLKWSAGQRGDPQRPQELEARQPLWVFCRMPFVQLGICLNHPRVFQELVAEVVHDRGDGEDATEAFIQGRLRHNVLPSLSRSESVAMPSRRATRLTIPKGTPVSWVISSTLLDR